MAQDEGRVGSVVTLPQEVLVLPQSLVLVDVEGEAVSGLVLRVGKDGRRFLVTYETGGRIATTWVPAERVRPADPTE